MDTVVACGTRDTWRWCSAMMEQAGAKPWTGWRLGFLRLSKRRSSSSTCNVLLAAMHAADGPPLGDVAGTEAYIVATRLGSQCWAALMSGLGAAGGTCQSVSMATDKGDGGGLPSQQLVTGVPDSMAYVNVPQVAL